MGTLASHPIPPRVIVSYIAANGPIAFATSLAPCANESRHAENTRGILKSLLIDFFEFLNIPENCTKSFLITIYVRSPIQIAKAHAVVRSTEMSCFSPFIIRYPVKLPAIIAI